MGVTSRPPRVPFLVAYGAENFLLDKEIQRARKWPGRDVFLIEGEDITEGKLISVLSEGSLGGTPITIVLDNAQKVKLGKPMKAFVESKSKSDTSTVLVAVARTEKVPAGWSDVAEKGEISESPKFKPWMVDPIIRWIETEASTHQVKLAEGVAKALLYFVDSDLYRLSNEVRKLAIFVGPDGIVQKEHLNLVLSATPGATVFQVAEATMSKNKVEAMNTFSRLYKNEGSGCLVFMTSTLMKQVERALIVRRQLDRGVDADLVAASVGLDAKKFPYRQLSESARKHTVRELVGHMGRLCRLDADVKGAATSKRTLVELAVLAIAS
jgi:DNA polymerase III delta subunit